jgi:antitoxin MazE
MVPRMKSQIRKLGNSQGVIIPKPLLDEIGVVAGDPVNLKVNKKGRLVMSPVRGEVRAGWAKDSKALAQSGETGRVWPAMAAGSERPLKW